MIHNSHTAIKGKIKLIAFVLALKKELKTEIAVTSAVFTFTTRQVWYAYFPARLARPERALRDVTTQRLLERLWHVFWYSIFVARSGQSIYDKMEYLFVFR